MKYTLLCFLLLVIGSCSSSIEFDKAGWAVKDDMVYPNRKNMLADLMGNHQLKGLSYNKLIALLGEPQGQVPAGGIWYTIEENYGLDIDPVSSKILLFEFNSTSTVVRFRTEEYKK
jgi:hypothetical protein